MRHSLLAVPAAALLAAATITGSAAAAPAADEPPSIAQLCLATGIEEVDALLDGVARTRLVDALAPLAQLTVPDGDTVELDASVQLADIRQALNCDGPDPVPTTTTPRPVPTTTTPLPAPSRGGFSQLDRVPTGPAETGGGPAA